MRRIKLTQGKYALVDDEDFDRINQFKWFAYYNERAGYWYARRMIRKANGKRSIQSMHRLIMNTPKELQTDHKNHNGIDNQRHNLRICTNAENHMNTIKRKRNASSRFKGVYWHKAHKKWTAEIRLNGKLICLGDFINETDAAHTYDKNAKELFGEFAYLNFKEVSNG